MSKNDGVPAADVFAIIEEPTAQMGPFMTLVHRIAAPFGGQLAYSADTHPVVVIKATGERVQGPVPAHSALAGDMHADLATMTARDFQNRYLLDP
jgi:hypothetical protein